MSTNSKEYRDLWTSRNPLYNESYQRSWRKGNPDKVKAINQRAKRKALSDPEKKLRIVEIQKKSYLKHKDKIRAACSAAHRKRSDEYFLFKQTIGCKLCGYAAHGSALDFHHRDPKLKICLVNAFNYRNGKGKAEIEKCDLLCANCHRVETTKQHREKDRNDR